MSNIKGLFEQNGIFSKLLIFIGLFLFCGISTTLLATLFVSGNAADVNYLKLMQLIQSVGMFILPPFVFAYFCSEKPILFLHLDRQVNLYQVGLVVLFMVLIIPGINLLTSLNQKLVLPEALVGMEAWMKTSEEQLAKFTEQLVNVHGFSALAFNVFVIAMIPAFGEELFFRGSIQKIFRQKMNAKVAIWITAIIFSAIHLQFYGFFPRMLLGALFGYLLFWSDNLWLPIVAHFTNNVIAVIFYYLRYNGCQMPDIDTVGTGSTMWLGILSAVLGILGFVLMKNLIKKGNRVVIEL